MDTIDNAVEYIRHNKTPFWWIKSGDKKTADNTTEEDLNTSVELFIKAVSFLPPGLYKLEVSRNTKDRSGSYHINFTKGQSTATQMQNQTIIPSTNPFGISDITYQKIQDETRRNFMFEQMYNEFTQFMKEWPDLKKKIERIEKIEDFLKDQDGDGTPDFLEMTKKGGEIMKNVQEVKKVIEGGSLFK